MAAASYRWLGTFSKVVVIIALGGLSVAQIIASSSNFHRLIPSLNKRCVYLDYIVACLKQHTSVFARLAAK